MSTSTVTWVPRWDTVVIPSAPRMPCDTMISAPRRVSRWVCSRSEAPSAIEPNATTAPAAGDSSVALALRGARIDRAPRMSRATWLALLSVISAKPSRSPSLARNSPLTSHAP